MQLDSKPFGNVTVLPVNLTEARKELDQVRIDTTLIQAQLAARPKPAGTVPIEEFREWREWHARAASAAHFKAARGQFLANWIRTQAVLPQPSGKPKVSVRLMPVLLHVVVLLDEMLGDDTDDLSPAALLALSEMRSWMQEAQIYLHDEMATTNGVAV